MIALAVVRGVGVAQTPAPITPILSLRVRAESWDWFDAGPEGRYAFTAAHARAGFAQQRATLAWRVELAAPVLLGLPADASAAAPAGALGLGANYATANNGRRDVAGLFVKQAFVRWGRADTSGRTSAKLGRFEFADGGEYAPRDPGLAQLRQQRIAQRLLGTFGFTHGQRAFDGAELTHRTAAGSFAAVAMRPTTGVFDVDGAGSLPMNLVYAAWNRRAGTTDAPADVRLFALQVDDHRGTVPTDSRPVTRRTAAPRHVGVTSLGGHWIQRVTLGGIEVDGLVWGVQQLGRWGGLAHRAGAIALEGGLRAPMVRGAPVLRVGVARSTGDRDAQDGTHGTFYQALPTPRAYAPFPFYNMQNSREAFVSVGTAPIASLQLQVSARQLRLAEAADLWFVGGGAFDRRTFGYAGRATGGHTGLGSAFDLTIDWRLSRQVSVTAYAARATGGPVMEATYGGRHRATFAYVETTLRR
jgi:hypothetical protein